MEKAGSWAIKAACGLFGILGLVSTGSGMTLVDQGRPAAVLVVAGDAPDSVRLAARELQSHLEKVSGAKLPIQTKADLKLVNIYIGESPFTRQLGLTTAGLKSDGFRIVARDRWVAIFGRDYSGPPIYGYRNPWQYTEVYNPTLKIGAFGEAGTLFGVYRFLEDTCGIRWYWPGELGTVIPNKATVAVEKIDLTVEPAFEYRYPWFCNFSMSDECSLWYRRLGFGGRAPAQIMHAFDQFLKKHKETHPEYFALIDGKRDFTNLSCIGGESNLCLSNPAVVKQWIDDVNDYFDKNPNQNIYPVSPSDGMVKICECKNCQSKIDLKLGPTGKFSNYVWTFVNEVAKGVAVKHPDKLVGCIAYEAYNYPPTAIKKLNPNVAVMICKMRGAYPDPAYRKKMQETIAGWRAKTDHLYFWEYYLYSWSPWRNFPVVFPHLIGEDLKALNGVGNGEFIESESTPGCQSGTIECPGMAHLNLYVTARAQWNPDLPVEDLLNEYYEKFYGPAQKEMKEFWTTAERIWMTAAKLDNPVNVFKRPDMEKLSACLGRAKARTAADSVYRKRVEAIEGEFAPARKKLSNALVITPPKLILPGPVAGVTLDGLLSDPAWQKFDPVAFVDKDGEPAAYKTWGYAAWDAENLYLAFINYEPQVGKLTVRATRRDQNYNPGLWEDDSVEIFIMPDPAVKTKGYQFIVNAQGLILDARVSADHPMEPEIKWDGHAEAKTWVETNRWVVEIKIPFKDLGLLGPVAGKSLPVNFYRNRYCGGPAIRSGWSPTVAGDFLTPERFGQINFAKK